MIQFYRNAGAYKAGDRVTARALLPQLATLKPGSFAVFREEQVRFAVGDTVRITGNGWDASRKHRIDNGRIDQISRFTSKGELVLANGWVVGKDFAPLSSTAWCSTSHADPEARRTDIVLAAMNGAIRSGRCRRNRPTSPSRGAASAA